MMPPWFVLRDSVSVAVLRGGVYPFSQGVQILRLSDATAALLGGYGKEIILERLQYFSGNWDSKKHRTFLRYRMARVSVRDQGRIGDVGRLFYDGARISAR